MLVVDASVALKFVVEEVGTDDAIALIREGEPLVAPDWMLAECASGLAKKVLFSSMPRAAAEAGFHSLPAFFSRLFPTPPLLDSALNLSIRLSLPLYDCLYLALALREQAEVITADRNFVEAAGRAGHGETVRLLAGAQTQ
jgi:predicted nucleic acid-binding protein